MAPRVVRVLVDADDDRCIGVRGRSRDDHLARAGLEMACSLLALLELPRALEDDVDAELVPRQTPGVGFGEDWNLRTVDDERVSASRDLAGERSVDGVVLEQRGERLNVGDVVDRNELEGRGSLERSAQGGPTD